MPAKTDEKIDLSKQLGDLLQSPDRVKALVVLLERTASPKELSEHLGISLSMASHHVQVLLKMQLIEHVRDEPRRGAVAHFYRAVMRPIWSDEDWEKLSVEERQQYATWAVQLMICDVVEALAAGTFNARVDTHTSRSSLLLDEQGRQELHAIQDRALKASLKVEAGSSKRHTENGAERSQVMSMILCVDMPPS